MKRRLMIRQKARAIGEDAFEATEYALQYGKSILTGAIAPESITHMETTVKPSDVPYRDRLPVWDLTIRIEYDDEQTDTPKEV